MRYMVNLGLLEALIMLKLLMCCCKNLFEKERRIRIKPHLD